MLLFALLVVCHASSCLENVASVANGIVNSHEQRRATWGINISVVQSNGSLQSVYGWNAARFVIPASNNKIPTTSLAFRKFGPLQTFPTLVMRHGNQLCVRAAGVPLEHDDLRSFVANISGSLSGTINVRVDDSLFGPQVVPGGWEWADMAFDYGAFPVPPVLAQGTIGITVSPTSRGQPASISFDDPADANSIQFVNNVMTSSDATDVEFYYFLDDPQTLQIFGTIGESADPVHLDPSVHTPAMRFAIAMQNIVDGITNNNGTADVGPCPRGASLVGSIPSAPLRTIMNHTLKESDNLEAELYMRHLGLLSSGVDNYANGLTMVNQFLDSLGVAAEFIQTDGSGLGRSNQLTPNGLVAVLQSMIGSEWVDYLPVGGESGTLRNRFLGTNGAVKAKTGSETGVNSLSGYATSASGALFVFSIINNGNSDIDYRIMHNATDTMVMQMLRC